MQQIRGAQSDHLLGVQFVTNHGRESVVYGDDSKGRKFAFKARFAIAISLAAVSNVSRKLSDITC